MSKKDIPLSPKHGLNPTMPICFFCGEEKGEIAILGKIDKADSEAPKHMILDYVPCKKCQEKMDLGVTLIGVTETAPDSRPPIGNNMYPTGRWAVLNPEVAKDFFIPEVLDDVMKKKKCLIDDEVLQNMQGE